MNGNQQSDAGWAPPRAWRGPLIAVLLFWGLWSFAANVHSFQNGVVDDAFISFRYARNLAEGHGLTWNPSQPPVEGFTNLLWILLLSPLAALGLDLPTAAVWGGVAASVACAVAVWMAARPHFGVTAAAVAAYLVLSHPTTARHSVSGLETALFALLLVFQCAALLIYTRAGGTGRVSLFFGLAALSTLCRPEAAGITLLWTAVGWLTTPNRRSQLLRGFAAFAAFLAVLVVWRFWYFGYWVPNTLLIKGPQGLGGLPSWRLVTFFFLANAPVALLASFFVFGRRWIHASAFVAAPVALMAAFYSSTHHIMGFDHRFMFPAYPFLAMLAGAGLERALAVFGGSSSDSAGFGRLAVLLGLAVLLIQPANLASPESSSIRLKKFFFPTSAEPPETWTSVNVEIGGKLAELGLDEGLVCLSEDAGAIAYYSRCSLIDPVGLTNAEIARSRSLSEFQDLIFGFPPDVVLLRSGAEGLEIDCSEPLRAEGLHGALRRFGKNAIYCDTRFRSYAHLGWRSDAVPPGLYRWQFFANRDGPQFGKIRQFLAPYLSSPNAP